MWMVSQIFLAFQISSYIYQVFRFQILVYMNYEIWLHDEQVNHLAPDFLLTYSFSMVQKVYSCGESS